MTPRIALALFALTLPGLADGLDKRLVAPDATWLVHVDVEAVLGSKLFELAAAEARAEMEEGLAEVKRELGLDPTRDVRSITVYGSQSEPEDAVVIVSATAAVDGVLPRLYEIESHRTLNVGGYAVHSVGDGPDGKGDEQVFGWMKTRGEDRLLVLAHKSERLLQGIEVVEGKQPSLAGASRPILAAAPAEGSFFFVAATGLDRLAHMDPSSQVAQLARSLVFDLGESQGLLSAHLALETENFEDAQRIGQVLQGVTALASLVSMKAEIESEEAMLLQSLVNALRFETQGNVVYANFQYDVQELVREAKELEKY